uniref:Putative vacuolar atpase assembly integral membrane protein vma21 n=1 Tax=Xenopsylla cheopis TaxID=163159 RepID=A0A6M2DKI9_XENCH
MEPTAENDTIELPRYRTSAHSKQAAWAMFYLFIYSVLMFTFPFLAFFGMRHYLAEHLDIVGFTNTACSVLMAVIIANAIIIAYAYRAYHEKEYDEEGKEIDQSIVPEPKSKDE